MFCDYNYTLHKSAKVCSKKVEVAVFSMSYEGTVGFRRVKVALGITSIMQ